jgi:hypothetical protein
MKRAEMLVSTCCRERRCEHESGAPAGGTVGLALDVSLSDGHSAVSSVLDLHKRHDWREVDRSLLRHVVS